MSRDDELDAALASYVASEPRPGLEGRVLQHLEHSPGARRPSRIMWLVPAMGLLAFASILVIWRPDTAPVPPIRRVPAPTVRAQVVQPRIEPSPKGRARLRPVVRRRLKRPPKREQFPSPSPLSQEERALLRFAEQNPGNLPRELTDFAKPIQPIQVAAIQIKPLE